jgi:hypothetical protein
MMDADLSLFSAGGDGLFIATITGVGIHGMGGLATATWDHGQVHVRATFAITPGAVPEPAALISCLIGVASLGGYWWLRPGPGPNRPGSTK